MFRADSTKPHEFFTTVELAGKNPKGTVTIGAPTGEAQSAAKFTGRITASR
jgi:hypothetical protein